VWVDYLKLVRYEVESCRRADHVLAMSPADAAYLGGYLPERRQSIIAIDNGVDTAYYTPAPAWPGGADLLFIGSHRHTPNRQGMQYFLDQVWPLICSKLPEAHLFVVGDGPWAEMGGIAGNPAVTATGLVDDTRPYLARCAVSLAPILSGSGTRIKILESLAAGIPVVSTTLGCEGITAQPGRDLLVADRPQDFASAVLRIVQDGGLAESLRRNGRRLVEESYDWSAVAARLDALYRGERPA
jgi:polysaccharide biosynthesis protein PslH